MSLRPLAAAAVVAPARKFKFTLQSALPANVKKRVAKRAARRRHPMGGEGRRVLKKESKQAAGEEEEALARENERVGARKKDLGPPRRTVIPSGKEPSVKL